VAAATAFALTACGNSSPDSPTETPGGGDQTTAESPDEPTQEAPASDTPFQISYNADAAHQGWVDAVANSIKNTLGINASGNPYPTFAEFRTAITERQIETAFRTGWQADYPGLGNFLAPLYFTNAGSNDGDYSSQEFDSLINQADSASSVEESNALFVQAQQVLLKDLPAIPLWYQNTTGGWGPNVQNVAFGWNSVPVYGAVTKTEDEGVISANSGEPQNPLIPAATNEVQGGKVLDLIFSRLVYYDADGATHNDMAESIESEDAQTWTVKLKADQTFTDGSPVDADSFINAWDASALASQGELMLSSYFFEQIEGFSYDEDVHIKETGLTKIDDLTFEIKLKAPTADWPLRLGYSAYAPLPPSAFTDDGLIDPAFGEEPIANGPYMVDHWTHNEEILLVPNPDYKGDQPHANNGVLLAFYDELDAAYADVLSGNLDIIDAMPETAVEGDKYQSELEGYGGGWANQGGAVFQSFTIPSRLPHFGDDEEGKLRRAALSMAVDRQSICDVVFNGTRSPAKDFTSPVISGWSESIEGADVLEYNPDKAKELWEQANAINPW
jgi:oligopeptide transport system substrate-binding protein